MTKRRIRRRQSDSGFKLAGEISQGSPIDASVAGESLTIPEDIIEEGEIVFRAARADLQEFGIERGDLLVVEQRSDGHATSAELVVVRIGDRVFVGHWWGKHGRRAVMGDANFVIAEERGLQIVGAITAIVRPDGRAFSPRP
jgi:bifunctional DNA-binding transcriptional regulator/antitoxin component of YhaV-PrlF toxin-antitoxin module